MQTIAPSEQAAIARNEVRWSRDNPVSVEMEVCRKVTRLQMQESHRS